MEALLNAVLVALKIKTQLRHLLWRGAPEFILEESELDQLIAAARSKRMAAYLQTLKETFADPGEALRIEWIEVSAKSVKINHPVKGA